MKTFYFSSLNQSPIGGLWLVSSPHGLLRVEFHAPGFVTTDTELQDRLASAFNIARQALSIQPNPALLAEPIQQILEYLHGQRRRFDFAIDWDSLLPFQRRVLQLTYDIPYGQTCTYAELASLAGSPKAARAVGRAQAANPMPLVIPCHRVVGTDGSLHGYGGPGGIRLKAWLQELERIGPSEAHSSLSAA
jgi:O-6-methylguanine DNA methyltransferase